MTLKIVKLNLNRTDINIFQNLVQKIGKKIKNKVFCNGGRDVELLQAE